MVYESQYYGFVNFNDPALSHHGIKGQKWGMRRYQNPDGSLTDAGKKRYYTSDGSLTKRGERSFNRDAAKLQKLKDRTNIDLQKQKAGEYDNRANKAGKVAAISGAAAASLYGLRNTNPLLDANVEKWDKVVNDYRTAQKALFKERSSMYDLAFAPNTDYETSVSATRRAREILNKDLPQLYDKTTKKVNFHSTLDTVLEAARTGKKVAAVGLAGAAGVSAGVYAYNKIQARLANKRTTDLGHEKAVQAYKAQEQKMLKLYGTTRLSELKKKQK